MFSLLALAMSIPGVMGTPAPAVQPLHVELSPEYRWALISALQRRLDGKFIITGLADADMTCRALRSCTSGDELVSQSRGRPALTNISSLNDLLSQTTINGAHPASIVSLRTSRQLSGSAVQVIASVYDAKTRRWTQNVGVIEYARVTSGQPALVRPKLVSWIEQN